MTFRHLTAPQFTESVPELVDLYIAAMKYPPAIREQRIAVWRRDATSPGFVAVTAYKNDTLVGIAYGFKGTRDRWWDLQLRRGLFQRQAMTPAMITVIRNYFEVAEIHVAPDLQCKGTGRKLMHMLLEQTTEPYALLSTPEVPGENNAAFGLYRSLGFLDVLRHFTYAGDSRPFAILGRKLPLT
ncbi:N-acetyltransferase [Corynebacterium tuscaniense]|uniref:N-acetyltransferase n=1 Tax=Corynebacterium tuscaniense TaxID=302449 RepID=A0A2N6T5B0_9CORY|nr:N-acetyltransferase [Corynebacterium tuscaniense]KGF24994.1 GNAT family acetyltraansferase [Corynebacterium tuscaniense DNF00037]PMC64499.1 N-acetyltransferase [Corynebacterium tuscaniense]